MALFVERCLSYVEVVRTYLMDETVVLYCTSEEQNTNNKKWKPLAIDVCLHCQWCYFQTDQAPARVNSVGPRHNKIY